MAAVPENIEDQQDLKIPLYHPLHIDHVRTFDKVTRLPNDLFEVLDDGIKSVIASTERYLTFILENASLDIPVKESEAFLNKQLQLLYVLLKQKFDMNNFLTSIDNTKKEINSIRSHEPPLSVETLDHYANAADDVFATHLIKNYERDARDTSDASSFTTILKTIASYQYIKNAAFIIQNPDEPLPEDSKDSEDIEISGGKVSLKDPLSMNYFKKPYKSRKCDHVYESEYIMNALNDGLKNCPVDGCSATLARNDLKQDLMMELRVKAFLYQERTRTTNSNLDRL